MQFRLNILRNDVKGQPLCTVFPNITSVNLNNTGVKLAGAKQLYDAMNSQRAFGSISARGSARPVGSGTAAEASAPLFGGGGASAALFAGESVGAAPVLDGDKGGSLANPSFN